MSNKHEPKVGNWYETADSQSLKVVSVDEEAETIEIQYLDGAHEEIDFNVWNVWEVESIVPPKDWEGLCDDDHEDLDDPDNEYVDDGSVNDESWDDIDGLVDEDSEIKEY